MLPHRIILQPSSLSRWPETPGHMREKSKGVKIKLPPHNLDEPLMQDRLDLFLPLR
jgi:hypothetical protein